MRKTGFCSLLVLVLMSSSLLKADASTGIGRRSDTVLDSNCCVHKVWQEPLDDQFEIFYKNNFTGNMGHGNERNPPLRLTESLTDSVWPQIAFDPSSGIIYVSWIEQLPAGDVIFYRGSSLEEQVWLSTRLFGDAPNLRGGLELRAEDGELRLEKDGVVVLTALADIDGDLVSDRDDLDPFSYNAFGTETIQVDTIKIDETLKVSVAIDYMPSSTNPEPSITVVNPGTDPYQNLDPLPGFAGTYVDIESTEKEMVERIAIKIGYGSLPSGVDEEDLVMYVWNSDFGEWEIEENTGVDTFHNYVWTLKDSLSGDINVPTDDEDADGLNNEQEIYEDSLGNSLAYWFEAEDYNATNTEVLVDALANDPDGDGCSAVSRSSSGDVIDITFTPRAGYYKYYVKARIDLLGQYTLRLRVTGTGIGLPDETFRVVNFNEYKWYSTNSFRATGSVMLHAQVSNTQWGGVLIDKVAIVRFRDAVVTTTDDPDGIIGVWPTSLGMPGGQTVYVKVPIFSQLLTGYVFNATMEISGLTLFANQSISTGSVNAGESVYLTNGTQWIAQRFLSPEHDVKLDRLALHMHKGYWGTNGAFGDLNVEIQTESANKPSGSAVSGGKVTVPTSLVPTGSMVWVNISFPSQPVLSADNVYWIVLKSPSSVNATYSLGVSSDQYLGSSFNVARSNAVGASWFTVGYGAGVDLMFRLYAAAPVDPCVSISGINAWTYSGDFSNYQSFDFSGPLNDYIFGRPGQQQPGLQPDIYGNIEVPICFAAQSTGILTFSKFRIELGPTVSDPRDPDTDVDSLEDGDEWTGVFDRDSDNDLMTDGYEIEGGGEGLQDPLKFNRRFALHLVVSFNWDVDSTYLNRYIDGMRMASNYLLDTTDGHMLIGSVTFYDNSAHWSEADIRVGKGNARFTTDEYWPKARVGGILFGGIRIVMPEAFLGHYPNETFSDFYRPYFTTLTHEIMHYTIFVYDEYEDKDGTPLTNPPHTIMNEEWGYSELSTRLDYANTQWNAANSTEQFYRRHESCWETFYRYWNSYEGNYIQAIRFDLDRDGVADPPIDSDNNGMIDVLESYVPDAGPIEDVGALMSAHLHT